MSLPSIVAVVILSCATCQAENVSYVGFDRNDYPGDANLKALSQSFSLHRLLAQLSSRREDEHLDRSPRCP